MTKYGDVLAHPHPAIDKKYTYIGAVGVESFHAFQGLQRLTGADGGSLDFGEGLAWWLRGEWSLPPREDVVEEPQEFILAVVSASEAARIIDDYLKGE